MASQLVNIMEGHSEMSGDDMSRLAWLYLHLKQEDDAYDCVKMVCFGSRITIIC